MRARWLRGETCLSLVPEAACAEGGVRSKDQSSSSHAESGKTPRCERSKRANEMSLWSIKFPTMLQPCQYYYQQWRCLSFRTSVKHLGATPFSSHRGRRTIAFSSFLSPQLDTLSPKQKEQASLYVDALLQWNQRMNLTAVTEASEVMRRHVEDSLAIIPPIQSHYLSRCGSNWDHLNLVDVGSGAGLPGLIFAIACPGWKVTLLESMHKRCMFLEHAVGLTGLSNVEILHARAETAGQSPEFREMFDVAVARAVAEMRVLAEYCLPLVRVGGLFVAAKGFNPQEEVKNAKKAIQLMGASILEMCSESHSPLGQRTAVVCLKDCPTPKKYPRHPGVPAKVPL